jgi:hypothetical protein
MNLRADSLTASAVRLGLETLEDRTLPSGNPLLDPTVVKNPVAATVQTSASSSVTLQSQQVAATQAAVASASFGYHWAVAPSSVLLGTNPATGNGKSTGSVAVALVRDGTTSVPVGATGAKILVGYLMTSSSAKDSSPDKFQTPFTLTLRLRDALSGASTVLSFKGMITGTMVYYRSSMKVTFQFPTQKVTLGKYVYTVSLPSSITLGSPRAAPTPFSAWVRITPK